jgi:serine/threonine-protein kinase
MPNLIGKRIDTVERELADDFTIRTKTYYSDDEDKGIITEQSIPAGVDYDPSRKNKLVVKVCMGPENVAVPSYSGYSKKEYLDILTDMNIKYTTVEESSADVAIGYVVRTSIDPGYNINVKEGTVLTVYISSGIEQTSSADASSITESVSDSSVPELPSDDSEEDSSVTDELW